VFVQTSSDGGQQWSTPILVSASGRSPAYEVNLLAGRDAALHLVWLQTVSGETTVVRHTRSSDAGQSWSRPTDLGPAAIHAGLRAAVDRCGSVHTVVEDHSQSSDRPRLKYAEWNGQWGTARTLFDTLTTLDADLRAAPDGSLILAFLGRPSESSMTHPPRSLVSHRRDHP
jgi:hypothetical protein